MAAAQLVARIKGYLKNLGVATDGQILIGDTDDPPAWKSLSGVLTITKAGLTAFAAGAVTAAAIADAILTGAKVAVVADANVIGGIPVLHRVAVPAGTTGDVDVVLTHKTRVIDVWLVKEAAAGGGAGTIQVKNGSDAITNAMSIDVNDQTRVEATTIDDSTAEIAAAGTLKVTRTRTASTDEQCTVYVLGVRVA